MILSIFNFRKNQALVICIFLGLVIGEIGIRWIEPVLSKDIRHWKKIPDIMRNISGGEGVKVLFLGNSLTRTNIVPSLIKKRINDFNNTKISIARIYPDDTNIVEWYYLFQALRKETEGTPTWVVVHFSHNHLQDTPLTSEKITRIGFFTAVEDLPLLIQAESFSVDNSVNLLLSKEFAIFRNRERVQRRVLALLPYYKEVVNKINQRMTTKESKGGMADPYQRLQKLLKVASQNHVLLIFCPAPLPEIWDIDPQLEKIIQDHGMLVLDIRKELSLKKTDFLDGYHLSPAGAKLYSLALGKKLAGLLK
jgi:hypothetical protein